MYFIFFTHWIKLTIRISNVKHDDALKKSELNS